MRNFYKIRCGEGIPGPHSHAKLHGCGLKNAGLQAPNLPKLVIWGLNLLQRDISP